MRGVENNRKGIGSSKSLGKWMLCWVLPILTMSSLEQVTMCVGEQSREHWQEKNCLNESQQWCFITFCANTFNLIISVTGMWCNATKDARGCLVTFLFKEGRAEVKATGWWEQIEPRLWWVCTGHQVLLWHRHPLVLHFFLFSFFNKYDHLAPHHEFHEKRSSLPPMPSCTSNSSPWGSENCSRFSVMLWGEKK